MDIGSYQEVWWSQGNGDTGGENWQELNRTHSVSVLKSVLRVQSASHQSWPLPAPPLRAAPGGTKIYKNIETFVLDVPFLLAVGWD